jgi:vesicle-fusing ATPase
VVGLLGHSFHKKRPIFHPRAGGTTKTNYIVSSHPIPSSLPTSELANRTTETNPPKQKESLLTMFKVKLQVGNLPSNRLALTNRIYVSEHNYDQVASFYAQHKVPPIDQGSKAYLVRLQERPYALEGHKDLDNSQVALNGLQRRTAQLSLASPVTLTPYQPFPAPVLAAIVFTVDLLVKPKGASAAANAANKHQKEIDTDRLAQTALMILEGQVLSVGQVMALDFEGTKMELSVQSVEPVDMNKKKPQNDTLHTKEGQLLQPTDITFTRAQGSNSITLSGDRIADGGNSGQANNIFVADFDFEKLGIGGLDAEFNQIFRRAFASRIWPSKVIKEMGITHVRGMLL